MKLRISGIICFFLGLSIYCCLLIEGFPRYIAYGGMFLNILGINLFISSFDFGHKVSRNTKLNQTISNEETKIISTYKYSCFDLDLESIIKIFYYKDDTRRIIFYEGENDIRFEEAVLNIIPKKERLDSLDQEAYWITIRKDTSFYETIEIAVKENEQELTNYYEEELSTLFLPGSKNKYIVDVTFNNQRKNIPFGFKYRPNISLVDCAKNLKDGYLVILNSPEKRKTKAIFYYIFDSEKKCKSGDQIYIFEGSNKVAEAKIIKEYKMNN